MTVKLFQLRFAHQYYRNGYPYALAVAPASESLKIMNAAGIFCKSLPDGLIVFCDIRGESKPFLESLVSKYEDICFDFLFSFGDAAFDDVTEGLPSKLSFREYKSDRTEKNEAGERVLVESLEERSLDQGNAAGSVAVKKDQIFSSDFELVQPTFLIDLKVRSTAWRYRIVNRSKVEIGNPSVTCDDGFTFDGPDIEENPDGLEAMIFSSGERMFQLSEESDHRVSLHDKVSISEEREGRFGMTKPFPLVAELPLPGPTNLALETKNGVGGETRFVSEMYVYL